MKQGIKLSICFLTFVTTLPTYGILRGRSFFSARSQSEHAERELVGWQETINLYAQGVNYGAFTVMPMYTQTFRNCEIAEYFFGTNRLFFSGSSVPGRGPDDILADYLGLPFDFMSVVEFNPSVANFIFDMNLYSGLDAWYPGLYVRMHAPLVRTTWSMNMCETITNQGSQGYQAGYMASAALERNKLAASVTEYFSGVRRVGDMLPLQYGKINSWCSRIGLSDIQIALGWNFIDADNYHFGAALRTAIPTGNHSQGFFFFEPIIGNGGFWEFGIGLTGHTALWDSANGQHSLAIYGDVNCTHLFTSQQRRSLDFKQNGHLNRYMLLEEMGTPIVQGLELNGVAATQQYHGTVLPAINVTTLTTNVSIALQIDLVIKLAYLYSNVSVDFGYDLWARTAECFHGRECFPNNTFALKGDAQVYGFHAATERFVAVNATQSDANIHAGQGLASNASTSFSNTNADNHAIATFEIDGSDELVSELPAGPAINGSLQAMLLCNNDLDNRSGLAPSAMTNSFFVHVNYAWHEYPLVMPFVGLMGELSIDAGSSKKTRSALNEWGIGLKGGVSY